MLTAPTHPRRAQNHIRHVLELVCAYRTPTRRQPQAPTSRSTCRGFSGHPCRAPLPPRRGRFRHLALVHQRRGKYTEEGSIWLWMWMYGEDDAGAGFLKVWRRRRKTQAQARWTPSFWPLFSSSGEERDQVAPCAVECAWFLYLETRRGPLGG